jgi:predicted metal-dependent peptidase
MKPVGGGGTRFQPAFDYVNENLPDTKVMIYFTDGYCFDKVDEPDYETLWIVYNNPTFTYNFGTIIHV